jgi:hypothetical protein
LAILLKPNGAKALLVENFLLRQQLLLLRCSRLWNARTRRELLNLEPSDFRSFEDITISVDGGALALDSGPSGLAPGSGVFLLRAPSFAEIEEQRQFKFKALIPVNLSRQNR